MTFINCRTRGPAPMTMGNLNEEASNHDASSDEFIESEWRLAFWQSEMARKSPPNLSMIRVQATLKVGWKSNTNKECFTLEPRTLVNGGPPKSAPGQRRWTLSGRRARIIAQCATGHC